MADMVGVMYHGELVDGEQRRNPENPAHPYTKALIRAIPTMDGKLPESVYVEERMPYTEIPKHIGQGQEVNDGKRNIGC